MNTFEQRFKQVMAQFNESTTVAPAPVKTPTKNPTKRPGHPGMPPKHSPKPRPKAGSGEARVQAFLSKRGK